MVELSLLLERLMEVAGKISKINSEVGYGFVQIPKLGNVFFSNQTDFLGASFADMKVDLSVRLSVIETDRGLFAKSLAIEKPKRRSPEADQTF